ncbi:MAG: ABC transporter ATP-binding protein [Treponema sp.]|nr:ABC transporter ATP-binding protein [Treponema sp.]
MSYLELKNINKIYSGNVQAVFDFNLDVEDGDFIVLVGPSGCGKSTVLRMIAGLEEISSGAMILNSKKINDLAPSDREIAMVFQDYALYGNMTVYQNIGFSLAIRGKSNEAIHDRVIDVSKTVELFDYLNRFPKALSGGQKQRVAMGRSLAKHAKVLLMDEPLSNLDAKLRQQTRRELAILHNNLKPTIIYVTHDQIEAMTLASKIVVMNEGRIQQIGSPYEIYHKPANVFTASFIGSPPINFIRGNMEGDVFTASNKNKEIIFQCKITPEIADNIRESTSNVSNIICGLRPEIISLRNTNEKNNVFGTAETANTNESICEFDALVETLEFLGSEYNAGLNTGGVVLTARIPGNAEIHQGQRVKAFFNIEKAHFFNEASGLRLKGHD